VGIGPQHLLPRVQEARAKRVSAEKLIVALDLEIKRLIESRDLLLNIENGRMMYANTPAWQRTANLIAWGASPDEIGQLVNSSGGSVEKYLQGSHLYVQLAQWGLSHRLSLQLSEAAIQSGIDPAEYRGILEILIQARRERKQPEAVAEKLILELPEADGLRQIRRQVLK